MNTIEETLSLASAFRVKLDTLAAELLVRGKGVMPDEDSNMPSVYSRVRLAKMWLGKYSLALGSETPYVDVDTVEDIPDLAERGEPRTVHMCMHPDERLRVYNEYRLELQQLSLNIEAMANSLSPNVYAASIPMMHCLQYLMEARMFLGLAIGKLRDGK